MHLDSGLDDYVVTMEATHHGPHIDIPCCFIELGSSEVEWGDEEGGMVIAKAIMSLQNYTVSNKWVATFGIGGPHYCPIFNKLQLNSKYAVSHVVASYNLPLTSKILKEAEEKTVEQVSEVLVDWKGCGKSSFREEVIKVIEGSGLEWKRTGKG